MWFLRSLNWVMLWPFVLWFTICAQFVTSWTESEWQHMFWEKRAQQSCHFEDDRLQLKSLVFSLISQKRSVIQFTYYGTDRLKKNCRPSKRFASWSCPGVEEQFVIHFRSAGQATENWAGWSITKRWISNQGMALKPVFGEWTYQTSELWNGTTTRCNIRENTRNCLELW